MKKFITVFLSALIIFIIFGCAGSDTLLEEKTWVLKTAIVTENGEARVFATDKENSAYPSAKIVNVSLNAADGKIIITDLDEEKTFIGKYSYSGTSGGVIYKVVFGEKSGFLVSSFTEYADGDKVPTLTLSVENYTLYFGVE